MSPASIVPIVVPLALVAALVWRLRRSGGVTPHPIEPVVTRDGASDGAH